VFAECYAAIKRTKLILFCSSISVLDQVQYESAPLTAKKRLTDTRSGADHFCVHTAQHTLKGGKTRKYSSKAEFARESLGQFSSLA